MTDQKEYNRRYQQAFDLCKNLLQKKLKTLGKEDSYKTEKTIQSVLGSFEVTKLIMHCPYNQDIYRPVIAEEIENTRKEFFPDLAKNRFITIDNLNEKEFHHTQDNIDLNNDNTDTYNDYRQQTLRYISSDTLNKSTLRAKEIDRLKLIKKLFPDGMIPDISQLDPFNELTDSKIIDIYKLVLSGIDRQFPSNFLATNGKRRCRVITKYLCEEINNISTANDLYKLDSYFFIENKLLNVLRFFNYSVNQILLNAFADKIQPWINGRIKDNYWEDKQNRISAVKWLVKDRLAINVKETGKINLNKSAFSKNGLSYLFNTYYNSVTKALSEAFPLLMPWQIGSLPAEYWNGVTIKQAVHWMFRRLNWDVDTLPKRYNLKELNRKTFSQFGLSGLFENKFHSNIYSLLSYVFPGKFSEWEFVYLNSTFWASAQNRKRFSAWLQDKYNFDLLKNSQYFQNLKEVRNYRLYTSLNKFCAGDMSKFARVYAHDLQEENKSRIIKRKWDKLIKQERKTMLQNLLVHGFFYSMVKIQIQNQIDIYTRKKKRFTKSLFNISSTAQF